jgi:hypothetical protein
VNITLQENANIVAAGNRNISNTNTEAQRDATVATNEGNGEIAK